MKRPLLLALACFALPFILGAQPCTPLGDQTTFGTNNVWLGYVYDNVNFTNYSGYVPQGNVGSPNFDQSFGGDDVNYVTNGCPVFTSTFSVRYKLRKTFAAGAYDFLVGADDGYRLSLDGGATWVINQFFDQGYATSTYSASLSGSVDMVLEFYENGGGNRVSFSVVPGCMGTENTAIYGTNDVWRGYVYDGTNFNSYKGMVTEGISGNMDFDQSFGGSNTTYPTSGCGVQTETFSVRYRLNKTFTSGSYLFIAGADDGFRLSLDNGATWVINRWNEQSYTTAFYLSNLNGNYNLVLEFYENGGDNRVSLDMQINVILKIDLLSFSGRKTSSGVDLDWVVSPDSDPASFVVERSADGGNFTPVHTVPGTTGVRGSNGIAFHDADGNPLAGNSYYRLKMTDGQGKVSYSHIVTIRNGSGNENGLSIYPTFLRNDLLYCRTGQRIERASIQVTDMTGRVIAMKHLGAIAGGQTVGITLGQQLTKGIYLVSILDNGNKRLTERIIVP